MMKEIGVMLNFWASMEDPLVAWYGEFSLEAGLTDPARQLSLLVGVHEVAERERIRQAVEPSEWHLQYLTESTSYTHAKFLQAYYDRTGELSLHSSVSTSRLCYYDLEGELIETDVKDTGKLLETLHPDRERCRFNMSYHVPVQIQVFPRSVSLPGNVDTSSSQSTLEQKTINIGILLYSDIWFPWVVGWLEERRACGSNNDKYDNRELAQCHTPRLNRFISTVRELVLEYGGNWVIDSPPPDTGFYSPMVTEQGILLDGLPKDMSVGF
jgi:hypothetical protein